MRDGNIALGEKDSVIEIVVIFFFINKYQQMHIKLLF